MRVSWVAGIVFLTGCRYTMGDFLPDHVHSMTIAPVDSEAFIDSQWDVERDLGDSLRDAFVADNSLRVVPGGLADSRLEVSITEFELVEEPGEDFASLLITVSYRFLDTARGAVIHESDSVSERVEFTMEAEESDAPVEAVIEEIAGTLASEIVAQTVRGW